MSLTVKDISFSYGKKNVLRNISLSLEENQILCVLGPNGVGKSTLFRCILGLQKGWSGDICLDGRSISQLPPREMAKRIAYIPQFSAPVFQYSVFQFVLMGTTASLSSLQSPRAQQEDSAVRALDMLGILQLRDRVVTSLSGGERQLVLIARALAQNSPLLVMDEPTASLDFGNAIRVMEVIHSLAEKGYGILLSTHDPNMALRYGTHALVMRSGCVESYGPPDEAITGPLLSRVYDVPIEIVPLPVCGTQHRICVSPGVDYVI